MSRFRTVLKALQNIQDCSVILQRHCKSGFITPKHTKEIADYINLQTNELQSSYVHGVEPVLYEPPIIERDAVTYGKEETAIEESTKWRRLIADERKNKLEKEELGIPDINI